LAKSTIFSPLEERYDVPAAEKIVAADAPTEVDNNLRHRLVQGEVHDENAFVIGGVQDTRDFSHGAGFGGVLQMLMNGGVYAHQRILRRATIAQFTNRSSSPAARGRWAGQCRPRADRAAIIFRRIVSGTRVLRVFDLDRSGPASVCRAATNRVHPTREYEDSASAAGAA